MGWFSEATTKIFSVFQSFSITDAIDIFFIAVIIYGFIKLIQETRAEKIVKGILILIVVWFLATQFNLKMTGAVLNRCFEFSVLAILVLFQPEIRKALEQIGKAKLPNYFVAQHKNVNSTSGNLSYSIDIICKTCESFSKSKTGALIVFERDTKLKEIASTGIEINATVSTELLGNIFFNKAPLHDGALIMRDSYVWVAGCILPLTSNDSISSSLGTRHRAAIGMSEVSDAVVVVVSEETGTVSIAMDGILKRNFTSETLKAELKKQLLPYNLESKRNKPINSFFSTLFGRGGDN